MTHLPIDIVPGSNPPIFRWQNKVRALDGIMMQVCEGSLPVSVEGAVASLIAIAKQLQHENKELCERLVAVVNKRDEAPIQQPIRKNRDRS